MQGWHTAALACGVLNIVGWAGALVYVGARYAMGL